MGQGAEPRKLGAGIPKAERARDPRASKAVPGNDTHGPHPPREKSLQSRFHLKVCHPRVF